MVTHTRTGRPRAVTSAMNRVRGFADMVLKHQRPIKDTFTVEREGNLERCRQMVRSMQQSFTALRALDRGQQQKRLLTQNAAVGDLMARSVYDDIVCSYRLTADGAGYEIVFELVEAVDYSNVVFADTGEHIADFNPTELHREGIEKQMKRNISAVQLSDVFWYAEQMGGMDDLFIAMVRADCELQRQMDWFNNIFKPAIDAKAANEAVELGPQTDKTTIDEQLDALGDDMFGES